MKKKRIDDHHRSFKTVHGVKQETFNDMLMDVKYLDITYCCNERRKIK